MDTKIGQNAKKRNDEEARVSKLRQDRQALTSLRLNAEDQQKKARRDIEQLKRDLRQKDAQRGSLQTCGGRLDGAQAEAN